MEFTKEDLNLENGLEKEWLITNGIGGYSSSTIIGANTRKYHGLLVAPLTPPARRFLILSKLDESIKINEKKYDLYTNICKEYISKGYEYQEEFRKEYVPIFKYKIDTTEITKIICMEYGKNTVGVYYKIKNGNFDTISACKYSVPSFLDIGKLYSIMIEDCAKPGNEVQELINIFNSFISDEISNFNSDLYYQNPDYLEWSYREGKLLD